MRLVVGGDFNVHGGRASRIVAALSERLGWSAVNGGTIEALKSLDVKKLKALVWMPNISNDEEKLLPDLKKLNPSLLLIQSKRVIEQNYTENDVIGRLLASHSNMGIMITRDGERLRFKLLDPLGNIWASTESVDDLGDAIRRRVDSLLSMRRVGSERVGARRPFEIDPEFIKIIRDYGGRFSHYVNAVNPNRLLGNASTRCAHGFPATKAQGAIYVTRRNVEKSTLSTDDFVEVLPFPELIQYYGDNKPSVDTPIQLRLFYHYHKVNYMMHGHVYVEGAAYTDSKIPCGYVDEFTEITRIVPDTKTTNFVINLRGHGCLILAEDLGFFRDQKLMGRPFPEGS